MIKVEHLSKTFGALTVLKDITTEIKKGEVVSIIGPSGTGKSTFLRCLNLLEDVFKLGATAHCVGFTANGGDTEPVLASGRNLRGGLLIRRDHKTVTGNGDIGQTEDLYRHCRPGLLDLVALVVDECTYASPSGAGHERIADSKSGASA